MERRSDRACARPRRARATTATRILAALLALAAIAACGEEEREAPAEPSAVVPIPDATGPRDVAVIDVDGFGPIRVELLPELAPKTVAQFEALVEESWYDGTTFHRVKPGFVIQGGDPNTRDRDPRNDGIGGREREIPLETSDVSFVRGVVAFANRKGPGTSGPQFFITLEDRRALDGDYALFGHVVGGMDVVDAIAQVPTDTYGRFGPKNRPLEDVVMHVRIEKGTGGTAATGAGAAGADADADGAPPSPADGSAGAGEPEDGEMGGGEWREGAP